MNIDFRVTLCTGGENVAAQLQRQTEEGYQLVNTCFAGIAEIQSLATLSNPHGQKTQAPRFLMIFARHIGHVPEIKA
jgi:hypothetical protein